MIFNLKSFQFYYAEEILEFCKTFTAECFEKGEPIVRQDDQSNGKMYCIINGKVGVYVVPKKDQEEIYIPKSKLKYF